ncbi:daptide-type RiPP biosynthesis methyltransferase [Kitasatospora sp. NPDC048540]|uniref:daptide-type RiPP biosynthesis methyltransferase n=1 Tax=Kitasatospora sp. NPDC048540 TaxID=3155634 RepID=UPI0033EA8ED1
MSTGPSAAPGADPRAAVPGRAGALLAELGDRAELHDLYDEAGAPVYHAIAGSSPLEVRELVAALRSTSGAVLELAAGSGRLTMPLLTLGRELTALELAPGMIRILEERLRAVPAARRDRCTVVPGDMSSFELGREFGAVVLGATSVSLLDATGRAGLYRCVRRHLAPGGKFLLTAVDVTDFGSATTEQVMDVDCADGTRFRMYEHWTEGADARTVTVFPHPLDTAELPITVCTTRIGVFPVAQLEAELALAGLVLTQRRSLPATGSHHHDVLLVAEVAA